MIGIDLSGRRALVTGASGGIGAGIARVLGEAGAEVVAHHRRDAAGAAAVAARTVHAVLDEPGFAPGLLDACGPVDVVVHNAADQALAPLADAGAQHWRTMLATNVEAVAELTAEACRRWVAAGVRGTVVAVSSIEARQPAPAHGAYAVAKAGLSMYVRAAAAEWGAHGIRVNAVSPGLIDRDGLADGWPEGVARWHAAAPLGRLGRPDDVAHAVAFLASDLAGWITGADLLVDGGVLCLPTW